MIFFEIMSSANAAAIKRRAQPKPTSAPLPQYGNGPVNGPVNRSVNAPTISSTQQNVNSPGLTLQQVISLLDKRLLKLESFMQESKNSSPPTLVMNNLPMTPQDGQTTPAMVGTITEETFSGMVDEFNHRFELLAAEIDTLKDIVIKLQSFTMEINKTLVNERIHIFSDLGNVQVEGDEENVITEGSENDTVVTTEELVESNIVPEN